jgi:hypothetical protein
VARRRAAARRQLASGASGSRGRARLIDRQKKAARAGAERAVLHGSRS